MKKLTVLILLGFIFSSLVDGQVPSATNFPITKENEQITASNISSSADKLTAEDVSKFFGRHRADFA